MLKTCPPRIECISSNCILHLVLQIMASNGSRGARGAARIPACDTVPHGITSMNSTPSLPLEYLGQQVASLRGELLEGSFEGGMVRLKKATRHGWPVPDPSQTNSFVDTCIWSKSLLQLTSRSPRLARATQSHCSSSNACAVNAERSAAVS